MTPPADTSGSREKLRALACDDGLRSPSMAATATRMQALIMPAKARMAAHSTMLLLNPMLCDISQSHALAGRGGGGNTYATQDMDNPNRPTRARGLRP